MTNGQIYRRTKKRTGNRPTFNHYSRTDRPTNRRRDQWTYKTLQWQSGVYSLKTGVWKQKSELKKRTGCVVKLHMSKYLKHGSTNKCHNIKPLLIKDSGKTSKARERQSCIRFLSRKLATKKRSLLKRGIFVWRPQEGKKRRRPWLIDDNIPASLQQILFLYASSHIYKRSYLFGWLVGWFVSSFVRSLVSP